MNYPKGITVDSPLGRQPVDSTGAAIGVVRLDANKSYTGIGLLLQAYINEADQEAWAKIKAKIDYTFAQLDLALAPLEAETAFGQALKSRVAQGQKLLLKPNLVNISCIDPQTHGPDKGSHTCTEWPFVAALLRWFHDRLGINYHQMALGEAATFMASAASLCSILNPEGRLVTTEAVIEGKCGGFYGGWGFYFARQYLAERHDPTHKDDPLQGYEESVAGTYLPPGRVDDKLMVYDLNRIFDDPNKGRDIPVPDGVNFASITLHKVIVGGDPNDATDRQDYPGCVLVNLPKLKVHTMAMFTNVIKNLGIGLYPMQATKTGECRWDYGIPHCSVPAMKGLIPHQVWVAEVDHQTGIPKKDASGNYIVKKTGGMPGTMVDIIRAVQNQGIYMLHVVDAIEAINLDHTGGLPGTKESEGLVFAGLDPVATDVLCARYLFKTVPLEEALAADLDDGKGGRFLQRVPLPAVEGGNIVTRLGYDCRMARDITFQYAEKRGLGQRQYYVLGRDVESDRPLVSLAGHLGTIADGIFAEVLTNTMYFAVSKVPWDLQKMAFSYFDAVDRLTGSKLKGEFLAAFDEDGDGVVSYEEFGKKGAFGPPLFLGAIAYSILGTEKLGFLRGPFFSSATMAKHRNELWNADGHDLLRENAFGAICLTALNMSRQEVESPDPFVPSLTWGKGKWPSFQLAFHVQLGIAIYGLGFPNRVSTPSLYSLAFRYADLSENGGEFTGHLRNQPAVEGEQRYMRAVQTGEAKPLDFTFYVPKGYGSIGGVKVPNVEETADPAQVLTVSFAGDREVWPDPRLVADPR